MTAPSTEVVEQELHDNPSNIVHLWCGACLIYLQPGQAGTALCGYTTRERGRHCPNASPQDQCIVCFELRNSPRRCGH